MATVGSKVDQDIIEQMGYAGEQGQILLMRIQLVRAIKDELSKRGLTQHQAAELLGVNQPRISELMQLRIDQFSVEKLAKLLYRLGKPVQLKVGTKS